MFFMIGNRIVEVKPNHIILSILLVLIGIVAPFLVGGVSEKIRYLLSGIAGLILISLLTFIIIKFEIIQKIRYRFSFQENLFESFLSLQENRKRILFGFLIMIGVFGAGLGLMQIDYNSLVNGINVDFDVKVKEPSIEQPKPVKTTSTTLMTTTTAKKKIITTTSSTTSTTTSTTTTTKKKKSGGFFSFAKSDPVDEGPADCTFYGKGHDAILMPSGNYYCRSTEKRIPIFINGVEKTCCVTP